MKKRIGFFLATMLAAVQTVGAVTIEQCVEMSRSNYPLIRKSGLLEMTRDIELSDINKAWLPGIGVYAQATVQNHVPSYPDAFTSVLEQMGGEVKGLGKVQYKIGVDLTQPVWDGGAAKQRRAVARAGEALQQASLDVELYAVRERVENICFAILLTESQIRQSHVTLGVLKENRRQLAAMLTGGVAMQSDLDMVEARILELDQSIVQAETALTGYRKALSLYTGKDMSKEVFERPAAILPYDRESNRPELRLFDRQLDLESARQRLSDTSLMPKIGFFAQAFYGYPGLDYFASMMKRDMSFNVLAGLKISWNIDAFYTKGNTAKRRQVNEAGIRLDRETFLHNSRIQEDTQLARIRGMQEAMKNDGRIVELRASVRKAAESQLANGVIDATALLTKISDESLARLTADYHEVELIKEIYKLKYMLDR